MIFLIGLLFILACLYWVFMSPFSQFFGKYIYRVKTDQKIIALTFDDGPNEPYTSQILDILKKHQVKATFFLVGQCALRYPDIAKRIVSEHHLIGNHSKTHRFRRYFQSWSFRNEITQTQEILKDISGQEPRYFRSPWLFRTPSLLATARDIGLEPVSGIFASSVEVFGASPETICNSALEKLKPGAILIFHDGREARGGNRKSTVKAIELFVPQALGLGYKFATVEELLN